MRKMLFFFGILLLYEGKEGAHIFPSVFVVLQPYTRKEAKHISQRRKQIIITSKEDENTTTTHLLRAH
jgi:hypothetical protein